MTPEVFLIFVASVIILVKSADLIIKASSNMAHELGVTQYFIGFSIVAVGTSLPELVTGIFASLSDEGTLILGDVLGANLLNVTLVLGVMALVAGVLHIRGKMFKTFDKMLFVTLLMLTLPILVGINGTISRVEGGLLIALFLFYTGLLLHRERTFRHRKHIIAREIVKDVLYLLIGIPGLLVSSYYLVKSALEIASIFNVSSYIIGLTVVALGTTVPELVVGIRSAMGEEKKLGFGNVLGSIIANMTLIIGVAAVIRPIVYEPVAFLSAAVFVMMATFVALLFLQRTKITWKEGLALLFIYVTFVVTQIIVV